MKKTAYILFVIIAVILLLNVLLLLTLNNKAIQSKLIQKVTTELSEKTGSKLSIGGIQLDLLDGLFAQDIYIEDLNQDTLAYIHELNVDYSLKNIYRNNTLCFGTVCLNDFTIKINAANDSSDYNFQFLVDAFSSDTIADNNESSSFQLEIGSIILNNGTFSYDIKDAPNTTNVFNYKHLKVNNLFTNLSLDLNLPGDIKSNISHFSCNEQSGLSITKLETEGTLYVDSLLTLSNVNIQSENSVVEGEIINYDFIKNRAAILNLESAIVGRDFRCFASTLDSLTVPIKVSGTVDLPFPGLTINNLTVHYPDVLDLHADSILVKDCSDWENSFMTLCLNQLEIKDSIRPTLKQLLSIELPNTIDSLLPIHIIADIKGSLPQLKDSIGISCALGQLNTKGKLCYRTNENNLLADNQWDMSIQTLSPFISEELVQNISGKMKTHLNWQLDTTPTIRLHADLNKTKINQYEYDTLHIDGQYSCDNNAGANICVNDSNCTLQLDVELRKLLTEQMHTNIQLSAKKIAPQELNWCDSLKNFTLSGIIQVEGDGMDYNQWDGTIRLNNFQLKNDSAKIHISEGYISQKLTNNERKLIDIQLPFLSGKIEGKFNYENLSTSLTNHLNHYLPSFFPIEKSGSLSDVSLELSIDKTDSLMNLLGLNIHQKDKLYIAGLLNEEKNAVALHIDIPRIEIEDIAIAPSSFKFKGKNNQLMGQVSSKVHPEKEKDLAAVAFSKIMVRNDSIYNSTQMSTSPDTLFLSGDTKNCISFTQLPDNQYKIKANFYRSTLHLNGNQIDSNDGVITIFPDKIIVQNIGLSTQQNPLLKAEGIISSNLADTLLVSFDRLKLQTIFSLLYINDIPADCKFSGHVKGCGLLGNERRFFTKDFRGDSITYANQYIGDMTVKAIWDNVRKGVFSDLNLETKERNLMKIVGEVKPIDQSIRMRAKLDSLPLISIMPFAKEYISNVKGDISADIEVKGQLTDPSIVGFIHFNHAKAKINYTGVTYSISDSLQLNGNTFIANRFKVKDDNQNTLELTGKITHDHFQKFNYNLSLNTHNFALLKNPKDKSKMTYGKFHINTKNLNLRGNEEQAELTGDLSNGDNSTITITLPDFVTEANTYDNIVYVESSIGSEKDSTSNNAPADKTSKFKFSAKLNLGLTDQAIFNVSIAEGVMIRGNGNLRVEYDENLLSVYNRFTVNDGYLKIRVAGLPTKKFTIQEGSYVDFTGDPMNLKFNATATYGLIADLATLNSSFSTLGMASTRVPVNCNLIASGSLSDIGLTYDVTLPKADEDLQQTVSSIINTDNIRIKEFAYLIGLGMFNDPSGQVQSDALMSFASSSLSATISNMLGGIIGDKVSIGTEINKSQSEQKDVEVGVSVSTKLANDKLILSTNIGYQKKENQTGKVSGDFDAEYLLGKTGMFRIKGYNHTNNEFYRSSSNTQGIGFSFVRESKKINELFKIKNEFKTKGVNRKSKRDNEVKSDSISVRRKEEEIEK